MGKVLTETCARAARSHPNHGLEVVLRLFRGVPRGHLRAVEYADPESAPAARASEPRELKKKQKSPDEFGALSKGGNAHD